MMTEHPLPAIQMSDSTAREAAGNESTTIDLTGDEEVQCRGWTLKHSQLFVCDKDAVLPTVKARYQEIMERQAANVCPKNGRSLAIMLEDTIPVIALLTKSDLVVRHRQYWLAYLQEAQKMHKASYQQAHLFARKITRPEERMQFVQTYGKATAVRMMLADEDVKLAKKLISDLLEN